MKVKLDASKIGAGAVLLQLMDDNKWHPVAFASWLLNKAQCNYSTTDREMLAIILALRKWWDFVLGRSIHVESDHMPLKGYSVPKDPHGRLAHWLAELQGYNIIVDYIKGIMLKLTQCHMPSPFKRMIFLTFLMS